MYIEVGIDLYLPYLFCSASMQIRINNARAKRAAVTVLRKSMSVAVSMPISVLLPVQYYTFQYSNLFSYSVYPVQ